MATLKEPEFETSSTSFVIPNYPRSLHSAAQIEQANVAPVRPSQGQGYPLGTAK